MSSVPGLVGVSGADSTFEPFPVARQDESVSANEPARTEKPVAFCSAWLSVGSRVGNRTKVN